MKASKAKKRRNLIVILLLVVLGLVFFGQSLFLKEEKTANKSAPAEENRYEKSVKELIEEPVGLNKVIVKFGTGDTVVKEYSSKTPFEALQKIAEGEGWQISTKEYKYGLMVESVNKISNSSGGYWTYKIDGQAGKIAADRYTLKKGEAVEWEYVKADN